MRSTRTRPSSRKSETTDDQRARAAWTIVTSTLNRPHKNMIKYKGQLGEMQSSIWELACSHQERRHDSDCKAGGIRAERSVAVARRAQVGRPNPREQTERH